MQQYVDRVDEFLEAHLTREAMPGGATACRHCNNCIAVWRCRDCVLGTPMCRSCIRLSHRENPFHRVQQWNGSYFRPASLSEVGTYLLIPHHTGEAICETLERWCGILDSAERKKDEMEQEELGRYEYVSGPVYTSGPGSAPDYDESDFDMEDFEVEGGDDLGDEDDFGDDDEELGYEIHDADPALAAATLGTLHRVVHTNGLHHIAMVSCHCHGDDILPLDLFAAQLLPASLKRIKTIFTVQVLDQFRLCNLELKASAYQYYQMLRRLTQPMSPSEVLNLYREFRRMTRIWRWMKKLKWAGYAGSSRKVKDVEPGELAIFCPACPQPGINIPDDWREDTARHVIKLYIIY